MDKIEIIPAIMPENIEHLENELTLLVPSEIKMVQLDLMDGNFVKERTWPYNNKDQEYLQAILREEEGLPHWYDTDFELDLMVNEAIEDLSMFLALGVKRLVFHLQAEKGDKLFEELRNMDQYVRGEIEIGLAFHTDQNIGDLSPWLLCESQNGKPFIDFVQCMGIDKIGYQGQPFSEKVIDKIKSLRKEYKDLTISVDGGVSLENASSLIEAGANRLVVGSAIFSSTDIDSTIREFHNLFKNQ